MASKAEISTYLVVALAVGFPVVFVAIWSSVCAIIARASGYRSLAKFRVDPPSAAEGEALPTPDFAMIGPARYRGRILKLNAGPRGLSIRIPRIFVFHPPVRVPWERVREDPAYHRILGRALLLDERVRLGLPEETYEAIRAARARYS